MKRLTSVLSALLAVVISAIALTGCPSGNNPPFEPAIFPAFSASIECGVVPFTVEFTNETRSLAGDITEWNWQIEDRQDRTIVRLDIGPNFFYTFDRPGEYAVTLQPNTGSGYRPVTPSTVITANTVEGECGGDQRDAPNSIFAQVYPVSGTQISTGNLVLLEPNTQPGAVLERFLLTGSGAGQAGSSDMYAVKTDWNGNELWTRTIGGDLTEQCYGAASTGDGGGLLVGETEVTQGNREQFAVRLDTNGIQVWSKIWPGPGDLDTIRAVTAAGPDRFFLVGEIARNEDALDTDFTFVTIDGDLIITGSAGDFFDSDLFIIRMDSEGEVLWQQTFVDEGDTGGYGVSARSNGDIAVIATTSEQNQRYVYDMLLVVTDADGEEQLRRRKGGEGSSTTSDRAADILESPRDGSFLMFGHSDSFGDSTDFIFVKANQTFAASDFDIPPQLKSGKSKQP